VITPDETDKVCGLQAIKDIQTILLLIQNRISLATLLTPSSRMMLVRWLSTVLGLMKSFVAIRLFE